eukprot:COSAG01_NODE_740_length_13891_cov_35.573013_6_plen_151_part_00
MIEIGEMAPDFALKNQKGEVVYLADYKGKRVVLYFYPKDNTPGCTKQAQEFSAQKKLFEEKNIIVMGVSRDSVTSHEKFCDKQNLNIILLSDPDLDVIKDYGVWQKKKMFGKTSMGIVRTTFLINEEGIVDEIYDKVKVDGHVDKIVESL